MKNLRMFIVASMCIALVCSASLSAFASIRYMRGDADSNDTVNINDVTMVQKVIARIESDSDGSIKRSCDFQNDGLSIIDATTIQKYLANYPNTYKIGMYFSYDEYELPFIPSR